MKRVFHGPVVVLINEDTGSNGEFFAEAALDAQAPLQRVAFLRRARIGARAHVGHWAREGFEDECVEPGRDVVCPRVHVGLGRERDGVIEHCEVRAHGRRV